MINTSHSRSLRPRTVTNARAGRAECASSLKREEHLGIERPEQEDTPRKEAEAGSRTFVVQVSQCGCVEAKVRGAQIRWTEMSILESSLQEQDDRPRAGVRAGSRTFIGQASQ